MAFLFWGDEILQRIKDNLFCIEASVLFSCLLFSIVSQVFVIVTDATKYINSEVLIKFYQWILTEKSLSFLRSVDGLAAVVGGVSLFVKKWAEEDTENIAVVLILAIALVSAHISSAMNLHIISFSLTIAVFGLLIIILVLLFDDSLKKSRRRMFKKSRPKIKN